MAPISPFPVKPLLILFDTGATDIAKIVDVFEAKGWIVRVDDISAIYAPLPPASLAAIAHGPRFSEMPPAPQAFGGGAGAKLPILLLGGQDDSEARRDARFDGHVSEPLSPDALAKAADDWRPADMSDTIERLEATFGRNEIRGMLTRLRAMLIEASAALGSSGAAEIAHRVAGVAGTLGFANAGRVWRELSEGGSGLEQDARRVSTLAIAAIDRRQDSDAAGPER